MGYRVQGVLFRTAPLPAALAALEHAYGYRLFELPGHGLWLVDLGVPVPKPGDRALIRTARPLAPSYVDALRVLSGDEEPFEQLAWLTASAVAARALAQPVLGFVSDDQVLDFAAVATPDGLHVIGDKLGQYLLRWEGGALAIQPFYSDGSAEEPPIPPEELSLIPAVTLLDTEELASGGYPLHGNVVAEMQGFADGAPGLGIGTVTGGQVGAVRLVEARGLDQSPWDLGAGWRREPGR
ncbi:MAG: hypothetical protein ACHQ01_08530 [Candidatus Limnocylindrales bacterium]